MRHHIPRYTAVIAATLLCLAPALSDAQGDRRLPDVLQAADSAWGARNYADALSGYAEVVRRDSTSARAVFRLATLLSWRNDLDRAIDLFREYVRLEPGDADGRIALARTLAWKGGYGQSMAIYDSVLGATPGHRDAALGAAQALAWSGRLRDAIDRYERWLSDHPDDADAWSSLAQVWQWSGRPRLARDALLRALAFRPAHTEAGAQLRVVDAALAPSLDPVLTTTNDSDDNRSTLYVIESGIASPWGARVIAGASYRAANLGPARGDAITLRAATSWAPSGAGWTIRGELGATRLAGRDGAGTTRRIRIEPLVSTRLSGRPLPRLSIGIGATRAAFDETAPLIVAGIATTTVEGDAEFALRPRLSASAGGGVTRLTGGSESNRRDAASGAIQWTLARRVSVSAGVRTFGYERAAADGYFAPKRYLLAEAGLRLGLGGEVGWGLDADLGVGRQAITAFDDSRATRFAQRAMATIAYRPTLGIEWSVNGGFANVASPTTIGSAEYRVWSLSVRGRVRL